MDLAEAYEKLSIKNKKKIFYLVLDGLGSIRDSYDGFTELQKAKTPYLDLLAKEGCSGQIDIVGHGITPGSGPGHLALFGYDPLKHDIGRGIFSALGTGFDLRHGDVAARINFATADAEGKIIDRRAGRIDTSLNEKLCDCIRKNLQIEDAEIFLQTVSEHRALFVIRKEGIEGNLQDTDPQETGFLPKKPKALDEKSKEAEKIAWQFIEQAKEALKNKKQANMVLMRGFDTYKKVPSLTEKFKLKGLCFADYPMYRGVSRFIGMDIFDTKAKNLQDRIEELKRNYTDEYDFYFFHVKGTDKAGEDGDYARKVKAIEEVDKHLPALVDLKPDVLIVTGDHSTPSLMKKHSWHPVPFLLKAKTCLIDHVDRFDELSSLNGGFGIIPAKNLMGLALAHAEKLKKFGA